MVHVINVENQKNVKDIPVGTRPRRFALTPDNVFFFFQAEDCIRDFHVTGVQTCALPISFRVTEAAYLVERMVDVLAYELDLDPAELRMRNLLRPEQFPYTCQTGWVYDSGDYPRALQLAMDLAGYQDLRKEQAERRGRGELMGIGISFFTEA